METSRAIESILTFGHVSSTYKFALFRALVDLIIESPCRRSGNGVHLWPLLTFARRYLEYYWPLLASRINQAPTSGHAATFSLTRYFEEFKDANQTHRFIGPALDRDRSPLTIMDYLDTARPLHPAAARLLRQIRQAIIRYPLIRFPNVKQRKIHLFDVVTCDFRPDQPRLEPNSRPPKPRGLMSYPDLEAAETKYLQLSDRVYQDLAAMRFWLRDAVLKRWAEVCSRYSAGLQVETFFQATGIQPRPRNSTLIRRYRQAYRDIGLSECHYCGRPLPGVWELDHLAPFRRFPVNLFWNLCPACPECNRGRAGKHDLVLKDTTALRERLERHTALCLASGHPLIAGDVAVTFRRFIVKEVPRNMDDQQQEIVTHTLNVLSSLRRSFPTRPWTA
ncbi:MAG: HNH endonuclease [Deltaproteobacteria bacterium]|nr:HNH endonuclease [Deltaproteobacteria bacterium]MBF0525033.1 HNH endonuclease [Deltaproteobacteria bacterium]